MNEGVDVICRLPDPVWAEVKMTLVARPIYGDEIRHGDYTFRVGTCRHETMPNGEPALMVYLDRYAQAPRS